MSGMSSYKIYVLDHQRNISISYDFEGDDDLAALEESRKYSNKHAVEVWQRSRLVACINLRDNAAIG